VNISLVFLCTSNNLQLLLHAVFLSTCTTQGIHGINGTRGRAQRSSDGSEMFIGVKPHTSKSNGELLSVLIHLVLVLIVTAFLIKFFVLHAHTFPHNALHSSSSVVFLRITQVATLCEQLYSVNKQLCECTVAL